MKKERKYSIYLKSTDSFVEVSKEDYCNYYRPIWAKMNKKQHSGECLCTKNNITFCDGDCFGCKYHNPKDVSLDMLIEEGAQIEIHNGLQLEDIDRIHEIISELPDDLKKLCQCLMDESSNAEIKSDLGYQGTNNAFSKYKSRLMEILRKEFAEYDPNNCK